MYFRMFVDSSDAILTDDTTKEMCRLLGFTAGMIEQGWMNGDLRDGNGNRIGRWYLETSKAAHDASGDGDV